MDCFGPILLERAKEVATNPYVAPYWKQFATIHFHKTVTKEGAIAYVTPSAAQASEAVIEAISLAFDAAGLNTSGAVSDDVYDLLFDHISGKAFCELGYAESLDGFTPAFFLTITHQAAVYLFRAICLLMESDHDVITESDLACLSKALKILSTIVDSFDLEIIS